MAVIKSVEEKYMKEALKQAKKAYALGEVPIGCVIVHEGKIIGRGYNRRNTDKNTLAHAEITAINKASKVIGDWRLEECTLYASRLSPAFEDQFSVNFSLFCRLIVVIRSFVGFKDTTFTVSSVE